MSQENVRFPRTWLVLAIGIVVLIVGGLVTYHVYRAKSDHKDCHVELEDSASFDVNRIQRGLGAVAEHANALGDWALAILAGSVAVVIGTSYLEPQSKIVRALYLVFIPGWVLLALSLYSASEVSRGYLASLLVGEEFIEQTTYCLNAAYARQLDYLASGTFCFSLWLVVFLFWWIFYAEPQVRK